MIAALVAVVVLAAAQGEPVADAPSDAGIADGVAGDAAALDEAAALADEGDVVEVAGDGQTVVGRKRDARRVVGSAHTIDAETLERFEADDVHRVLRAVPGVYVRDEDGQGLRPNIGLRGASSDRSAKVALLEDGVLFAPAPYAAPAAYYFPLTTRTVGVEVFKGPAAIRQGPHTVGGAINLRTRGAPYQPAAALDLGVGFVGLGRAQHRLHGWAGTGEEKWGVVVEAARVASDGFKHVEGLPDAPTGFVRDEAMLKVRVGDGFGEDHRNVVELKLGFQREESDETYLGLSDADFRVDPDLRYAASQGDRMEWSRTQAQLRWGHELGEALTFDVVGYRHDLDRTWRKVNGVEGAGSLHDVLAYGDVGRNPIYVAALRGADDEVGLPPVRIGPNERRFYSHGVAAALRGRLVLGEGAWQAEQRLEVGARLHQDGVDRRHTERAYRLVDGALHDLSDADIVTADNRASATALALHVVDEIRFWDLVVVPGVRVELIGGVFDDRLRGGGPVESFQVAVLPGAGVAWQALDELVVIAGVHRGFSPIAPGSTAEVRPEESTNAEAGVRVDVRKLLGLTAEVVGFASHYENLLGDCTFSAGCVDDVGRQLNGGAAFVGGVELAARHVAPVRWLPESSVRTDASYTFTHASFLTSFDSPHPLFGRVEAGDEMAYVPAHQAAVAAALVLGDVDLGASVGLIAAMRDVPGQGAPAPLERTDHQAVVDLTASWRLFDGVRAGFRVDNALDQRAIVSRRPFGARPGKPRTFMASLEFDFGR